MVEINFNHKEGDFFLPDLYLEKKITKMIILLENMDI